MADESTNGTAVADSTPASAGGKESVGSWFDRAFRPFSNGRTVTPPASGSQEEQASDKAATDSDATQQVTPATAAKDTTPLPTETPSASKTVTLTEDELQKRIDAAAQAETDRRERVRAAREAEAARRQKRENLKELLDTDVHAAAAATKEVLTEEEKAEQQQAVQAQMNAMLGTVRTEFDNNVIRPVLDLLSPDAVQRIVSQAPAGLEGRKLIIEEAVKALVSDAEKRGEENARKNLQKDPTFKKRVLLDVRGEEEEPDAPAAASPTGLSTSEMMTNTLRQMAGFRVS